MFSFIFRGKDSFGDFGIIVEKRPVIPKPLRRVEYIDVPGRSGSLMVDDATYQDIIIPLICTFRDYDDVPGQADRVRAWLDGGESQLFFSNQLDKYYLAHTSEQFDIAQEYKIFGRFQINFRCRPFKFTTDNTPITLSAASTIINPGNQASEPVIIVTGSGTITLTINGISILLASVDGHVTIDSVLKDAYKDTALKNNDMTGDFPFLKPGENSISWTGSVTSVEITPNWRWL